ncbi:unnamed protein product [Durusdinium trenchii]|uniref:Uncharacterized protein n=1 Tax=Durusdinium trenchii TaxID=1381693 RepID=A0ABP0S5H0_9DINO
MSQALLPIHRALLISTCPDLSCLGAPRADLEPVSRGSKKSWMRADQGGILIALSDNQLKSFGHKCDDDECGPKAASARAVPDAEGTEGAPLSFFQAGASMQPRAVDAVVPEPPVTGASLGAQHVMTEVFPEAAHVANFSGSLLQLAPRAAGTTSREGQARSLGLAYHRRMPRMRRS